MDDPEAIGSTGVASTLFLGTTTYPFGAFYRLSCINCATKAVIADYHDNHAILRFEVASQQMIAMVAVRPPNRY